MNLVQVLVKEGGLDPFTAADLMGAITEALTDPSVIADHGPEEYKAMVAGLDLDQYAAAVAYREANGL